MSRTALEPMVCACGLTITPRDRPPGSAPAASSYETCLYQCECGRGYSNSSDPRKRTCIVKSPELNAPHEVRAGLEPILAHSLNQLNIPSKRAKFCFSTSEDAVTWTIFRWLESEGRLSAVGSAVGEPAPADTPELLLWGAPTRPEAEHLRDELVQVLDHLGERRLRRSEPDVILAWPSLLVFIEVKYRSPNDRQPNYANFARYLDRADLFTVRPDEVAETGFYELVRNWRIGAQLAEETNRDFLLINLGPKSLATDEAQLRPALATSPARRFVTLSWGDLLGSFRESGPRPEWITTFIESRQLDTVWA